MKARLTTLRDAAQEVLDKQNDLDVATGQLTEKKDQELPEIRMDTNNLKSTRGFTDGDARTLEVATHSGSFDPDTYKPHLTAASMPGRVEITGKKTGADALNLYVRRKGEADFRLLAAKRSRFPFDDTAPPVTAGQPEEREYRAIGVLGDDEIGQPSDIVSAIYTVKERLVYPVAGMDDEDAPKTTYARSYFSEGTDETFQVQELTTTQAVVPTTENGSGVAGVITTSGNDRITSYAYDFRDRRDTTTQTDGTMVWITQATYDNLNRVTASVRYHSSVSNANRITQGRTYYDDLGRVFKTETDGIDPATGNVTGTLTGQSWYDLVGNVIKQSQAGSTAFTKTVYDELNRPKVAYLCCRPGVAGVPAGDDNSVVDDTVIEQSNTLYDAAGNVLRQTRKQRFDDAVGTGVLNGPQTEPKSRDTYGMTWPDALGRPRVSADYGTNGGSVPTRPAVAPPRSDTILVSTNRYKDSGDANAAVDPMGIETRWENDQAGRRIRLIEGIAPGTTLTSAACTNPPYPPPPAPRFTEFGWHASGQLNRLTLVNAETGNQVTRWLFGTTLADSAIASNSLVRTKIYPESDDRPAPAADGPDGVYSRLEYRYNRQGQQTAFKDADGTTHEYAYDKLGNPTADRVAVLAAGLNDDVLRIATTYDQRGLTAKVTSYDAATGGMVVNEVGLEYNAFGQLAADKQSHAGAIDGSTPKVTYSYESGGTKNSVRRLSTTYPTSSRVVEVRYGAANSIDDHLGRVSALQMTGEGTELVNYTYCGQAWQVRVGYPTPGLELKYRRLSGEPVGDAGDPYSGYDRFGRTVDLPWIKTSDDSIVERSQYGFDRDSRRTWQKRSLTDAQDQQYNYDALSQVAAATRGSLNLNATAISGTPAVAQSWDYDPTGNWRGYHTAANGTSTLDQHRVHDRGNRMTQIEDNPNNMILDRVGRMRQMSPDAAGDWDGRLEITWDAWSRITRVKDNGTVVGEYAYDGAHRRVTREVGGETLHSYYNSQWRPVEERKNAETTAAISYLWGARHRDDLVRRDRAVSGTTLNESRYVMMDYFNPAAITDASGLVKERYAFSAFGVRTILNPDFTVRSASECGMEFGFQGQFLDVESDLMNYGYRYYSPQLGRWTCKDPIGEDGGFNLYRMEHNEPMNKVDALGLEPIDPGACGDCQVRIYVGHNTHVASVLKNRQKELTEKPNTCVSYGSVSCTTCDINNSWEKHMSDNAVDGLGNALKKYETNDPARTISGTTNHPSQAADYDGGMQGALRKARELAISEAKQLCGKERCKCKTVSVDFKLVDVTDYAKDDNGWLKAIKQPGWDVFFSTSAYNCATGNVNTTLAPGAR